MLIHKNPDEAVRKHITFLDGVLENHGPDAWKEAFRDLARHDLWFLNRVVLDFGWLDENLHGKKLLKFMLRNEEKDQCIVLPRGHCKTLMGTCSRIVQLILKDPNTGILVVSATDELVKGIQSFLSDTLINNTLLQRAFSDILPCKKSDAAQWSTTKLQLPERATKARLEPTVMLKSVRSEVTGLHPEHLFIDDPCGANNNTPDEYKKTNLFIDQCKRLLLPHGRIYWNGTRWGDGDSLGQALDGELLGNQGKFETMVLSCFKGDDPTKGPIYPKRKRWNMDGYSGYSREQLIREMTVQSRESRRFFSCQMRNNPVPTEDNMLDLKDIEVYKKEETPQLGMVIRVGVEITGGGRVIYNHIKEQLARNKIALPLLEVNCKRQPKETKADRITAVLEPIISSGRLKVLRWMLPADQNDSENLGYEIGRLHAAKHDDIVDALHIVPEYVAGQARPMKDQPALVFIGCDLAWTENKSSDWTVYIAVAVDHEQNFWVLDYDRFQHSSPTVICNKLVAFYQKIVGKCQGYSGGKGGRSFGSTYN